MIYCAVLGDFTVVWIPLNIGQVSVLSIVGTKSYQCFCTHLYPLVLDTCQRWIAAGLNTVSGRSGRVGRPSTHSPATIWDMNGSLIHKLFFVA